MLDISDLAHKLLGNIRNTSLESCCPLKAARWTFSATQTSMPQYTGLDGDRYHVACFLPNLAAYVSWRVLQSAKWDKCHHNHPILMAVLPVNMFLLAVINFFFHVFLNKTFTNKQHRYVMDWLSVPLPNQQCQSTEGSHKHWSQEEKKHPLVSLILSLFTTKLLREGALVHLCQLSKSNIRSTEMSP